MPEQTNLAIEALKEWGNNAYFAGIIDGEGCISLTPNKRGVWNAVVIVASTFRSMLEWIEENYGGGIHFHKRGGNRKHLWDWRVSSKEDISNIIDKVLPFLIIKREQALLMKKYCSRAKLSRYDDMTAEREYRMGICYALKELNKRGIKE